MRDKIEVVTQDEKNKANALFCAAKRSLLSDFLKICKEQGISAKEIAQMWGVSPVYISHMKRGFRGVDVAMIIFIARKFDIKIKVDFSNILEG
jgi:transcriptional regulator with XRE-family HTH domain